MITFLPYKNFNSVELLDSKRLFKQAVEARQMINALEKHNDLRIEHHPATQAWKNNIDGLKLYYDVCLEIAKKRGFNTSMEYLEVGNGEINPWWLGEPIYHQSMRSRLYTKNPDFYKMFEEDAGYNQGNYWYPMPDTHNFFRQDTGLLANKEYATAVKGKTYIYEDQWKFSTMKVQLTGNSGNTLIFMRMDKHTYFKAKVLNDCYIREDDAVFKLINPDVKYRR